MIIPSDQRQQFAAQMSWFCLVACKITPEAIDQNSRKNKNKKHESLIYKKEITFN